MDSILFAWRSSPAAIRRACIAAILLVAGVTTNAAAQIDVLYLYNSNNYTDMCQAIGAAAARYPGLTLDARGFSGTQYCSAVNATAMLGNNTGGVQGKLLLGDVTMVIDGPPSVAVSSCLRSGGGVSTLTFSPPLPAGVSFQVNAPLVVSGFGVPCSSFNSVAGTPWTISGSTSSSVSFSQALGPVVPTLDNGTATQASYIDGNNSGLGTPAIVIPNQYWGIQGLSRQGTTIQICTDVHLPVQQCNYPFPQRALVITGTAMGSVGSQPALVLNVSSSLVSGTNIYPGEYVHIVGNANFDPQLPALKVAEVTDSTHFKVYVPSTYSQTCSGSPCGTAYLMTPVIGFGPSSGPYKPNSDANTNSFGQHVHDLNVSLGYNSGGTAHAFPGAVGIQNVYCEETCGANNVAVQHVYSIGLEDYSTTSQNAGPWTNIVVATNAGSSTNNDCDYGTTGVVMADAPDRGISGWTITLNGNCNGHQPVTAILMDKPGTPILHGHNENTKNAVLVGSQGAIINGSQKRVGGVKVEEVLGPPSTASGTNIVHVSDVFATGANSTVSNVFRNLVQQTGGSTNAVVDDIAHYTCTDQGLSYYETDFTGFPSTDCSVPALGTTPSAFILNNATLGIYKGSTTPIASMSATRVKVPSVAGCTSANDGEICYDSTSKNTHIRANNLDAIAGAFTSAPASNDCLIATVSSGNILLGDFTHPCMTLAGDLGNTYAAPQVTATHLASPLPANQGGTGGASGSVTNMCAGATSLSIPPNSTVYLGLANSSGTESQVALPVPINGTVTAMHVQMSALPTTYSVTFQARSSGGNLLGTCPINTTGNTWCDVTGSQSISEGSGSTWDIQATAGSGAAAVSRNYTVCLKVTGAS